MSQPPQRDAALERLVLADLQTLARSWQQESSHDTIRSESALLRKLLVDGGGLLQRYRRMLGLHGEPMIEAYDLFVAVELPWAQVHIAGAGGAFVHGVGELALYQVRSDHLPSPVGFPIATFKLKTFLATPAMIVRGQPVSRLQIIKYVANKLGGVHYDPSRNRKDDAVYSLLDAERGHVLVMNGIDLVHFELLAIGQHLLRSPDIADLLPVGMRPTELPPLMDNQHA